MRLKKLDVQKDNLVTLLSRLIKTNIETTSVVIATGYYDHPNYMVFQVKILPKVFHYFKEGHPFFDKDVVVIGVKNSGVDAAVELEVGARVTVLYRGSVYSEKIKPWILPEFDGHVRNERTTGI